MAVIFLQCNARLPSYKKMIFATVLYNRWNQSQTQSIFLLNRYILKMLFFDFVPIKQFRVPHTCAFPQFWTSLFCFCSFNSCFFLWLQIVFVGMSVGCPVWGWLSDNLGRKSVSWHDWVTMLQHCSFVNWGLNLWNDFHF